MSKSYRYDLLVKHSNETALLARQALMAELAEARKVFGFLDQHFHALERQPKGLVRNVKLALTARFTNHLFSGLLLIERGLLLDAFSCSRSALETTAFYCSFAQTLRPQLFTTLRRVQRLLRCASASKRWMSM